MSINCYVEILSFSLDDCLYFIKLQRKIDRGFQIVDVRLFVDIFL